MIAGKAIFRRTDVFSIIKAEKEVNVGAKYMEADVFGDENFSLMMILIITKSREKIIP